MEASHYPQQPPRRPLPGALARIPDSLTGDRSGFQRLDLMVNTVLDRLTAVEERPPRRRPGRTA